MLHNKNLGYYKILGVLGQTDHSIVYLGIDSLTHKYYALKAIPKSLFTDPSLISKIKKTVLKLIAIRSWQLNKIYKILQTDTHLWIVLEHCPHHSLNEYLDLRPFRRVNEREAIKIIRPLLEALNLLHNMDRIHGNIKPQNILINNGFFKLSDYSMPDIATLSTMKTGTINYRAPEVLFSQEYDDKVDIWSVGVVLFELVGGRKLFEGSSLEVKNLIKNHKQIDFSQLTSFGVNISKNCQDLLQKMVCVDPIERISWEKLWGHPVWKESNNAILEQRLDMINLEDLTCSTLMNQYQEVSIKLKFKNRINDKEADVLKSEINTGFSKVQNNEEFKCMEKEENKGLMELKRDKIQGNQKPNKENSIINEEKSEIIYNDDVIRNTKSKNIQETQIHLSRENAINSSRNHNKENSLTQFNVNENQAKIFIKRKRMPINFKSISFCNDTKNSVNPSGSNQSEIIAFIGRENQMNHSRGNSRCSFEYNRNSGKLIKEKKEKEGKSEKTTDESGFETNVSSSLKEYNCEEIQKRKDIGEDKKNFIISTSDNEKTFIGKKSLLKSHRDVSETSDNEDDQNDDFSEIYLMAEEEIITDEDIAEKALLASKIEVEKQLEDVNILNKITIRYLYVRNILNYIGQIVLKANLLAPYVMYMYSYVVCLKKMSKCYEEIIPAFKNTNFFNFPDNQLKKFKDSAKFAQLIRSLESDKQVIDEQIIYYLNDLREEKEMNNIELYQKVYDFLKADEINESLFKKILKYFIKHRERYFNSMTKLKNMTSKKVNLNFALFLDFMKWQKVLELDEKQNCGFELENYFKGMEDLTIEELSSKIEKDSTYLLKNLEFLTLEFKHLKFQD